MTRSTIPCPFCNTELQARPDLRPGDDVRCPSCDRVFQIPQASASAPTEPAPAGPDPEGIAIGPGARPRTERVTPDADRDWERWGDRQGGAPEYDEDHPPRFYRDYGDGEQGRTAPLSNQYEVEIGRWFEIGKAHFDGKFSHSALYSLFVFLVYLGLLVVTSLPTAALALVDPILHYAVSQVLGALIGSFVIGPLAAGLSLVALKQLKGEPWEFGDFFGGLRGQWYLSLVGYSFLKGLIVTVSIAPAQIVQQIGQAKGDPQLVLMGSALLLPGLLVAIFLEVRLGLFGELLILDRRYGAIDAVKGNWELTEGHFWMLFVVMLLLGLINVGGALLCCVGLLFSVPFTALVTATGYLLIAGTRPPLEKPYQGGGGFERYDTDDRYGDR